MAITAQQLIDSVLDPGSYQSWDTPPNYGPISDDYAASLAKARAKSGVDEAVITGEGVLNGHRVAVVLGEFSFLGGSIGAATAERITAGIERATAEGLPLLVSPTSGGTRMQEGTPAFMAMITITTAVNSHKAANLPFLVYLRNPTTGGVLASWGSSGHFTFAEPGALIGFLGPRVYELTRGEPFPEGVQLAENLVRCGVIDGVKDPAGIREGLERILRVLVAPGTYDYDASAHIPIAADAHLDPEHDSQPDSAWDAICRTRDPRRPGIRTLINTMATDVVPLSGTTDGRRHDTIIVCLARLAGHPVVLVGQDRSTQTPDHEMNPAALRFARRGIELAGFLNLPVVTIVDTPGAELSQEAEEHAMAGEIARTLRDLLNCPTPTISVVMGQGCGGGALALLPADKILCAKNGWVTPLPPEGASAIMHRTIDKAAEMAGEQSVTSVDLKRIGLVDAIIPERPDAADEPEQFCARTLDAIVEQLLSLPADCDPDQRRATRFARFRDLPHYWQ